MNVSNRYSSAQLISSTPKGERTVQAQEQWHRNADNVGAVSRMTQEPTAREMSTQDVVDRALQQRHRF